MNQLVKWNRPEIVRPDKSKIDQALARLREDTCEVGCVCAVHDRSYIVRYVRGAGGLYQYRESVKVLGNAEGSVEVRKISMRMFAPGPTPCPWCGDSYFHHCCCGAFVCGGRMTGNTFRCRDSCGATWEGVPLDSVSVTNGAKAQAAPRPMQAPRLMLTSGK